MLSAVDFINYFLFILLLIVSWSQVLFSLTCLKFPQTLVWSVFVLCVITFNLNLFQFFHFLIFFCYCRTLPNKLRDVNLNFKLAFQLIHIQTVIPGNLNFCKGQYLSHYRNVLLYPIWQPQVRMRKKTRYLSHGIVPVE